MRRRPWKPSERPYQHYRAVARVVVAVVVAGAAAVGRILALSAKRRTAPGGMRFSNTASAAHVVIQELGGLGVRFATSCCPTGRVVGEKASCGARPDRSSS